MTQSQPTSIISNVKGLIPVVNIIKTSRLNAFDNFIHTSRPIVCSTLQLRCYYRVAMNKTSFSCKGK